MSGWTPPEDPLVGLTDDARVAEAIADRARQRDLGLRAAEVATLAGTLRDLAERGTGTILAVRTGRSYQGVVVGVASDHVVLVAPNGQRIHVRTDAITTVRTDPDVHAPVAQGDRDAAQDQYLLERCARWVVDRPTVALAVEGTSELVRGQLVAVGEDVVSLLVEGSRTTVYVAADAVVVVAIDR